MVFLIWSGTNPKVQFTWFFEVAPAINGAAVLSLTYKSFRLTPLVYGLILIHCIILMIGGHCTYAEVPFFDSLKDIFGFTRSNFDKFGHFAQGFVPALIAREIILRKNIIHDQSGSHFSSSVSAWSLALSAFYELIEWWIALLSEEAAEAFLVHKVMSGTRNRI